MTANIVNGKVSQVFRSNQGSHTVRVFDEEDYLTMAFSGKYTNTIQGNEILASVNEDYVFIADEFDDEDNAE